MGSFLNVTIYRRGNPIRKAALFLACGHFMGVASYIQNLDRYFDSVYPLFKQDAVSFSQEEKEELARGQPQGEASMEE